MISFKTFLITLTLVTYVRPSHGQINYNKKTFPEDVVNQMIENVIKAYKSKLTYYLMESNNEVLPSMENATYARKLPHQLHEVDEFDFDFFIIDQDFNRTLNEISVDSVSHNYLEPHESKDESQKGMDETTQNWEEVWNAKWDELKKEMNPRTFVQSFSIISATEDLRKLAKKFLSLTTKYREQKREERNMFWNLEHRIITDALINIESILHDSTVKDFKLKQYGFFGKLFHLIKQRKDSKENLDKLYKDANRILEYSKNFWMNQWLNIKNLAKSDPEKLEAIEELESDEEQSKVTTLDTRFQRKLVNKYNEQVDQLKQLNEPYSKIVIGKLLTYYPQSLEQLSASLSGKPAPSRGGGSELMISNVIRQLVYNYRQKIIKILEDNTEKLTNLWNQSLEKGVSNADFKQFYKNVNKEIKRVIKQIDLEATLQELDQNFN